MEPLQPRLRLTESQEKVKSPDYSAIVSVMEAVAKILAVRLLLLLSVLGSIGLAFVSMEQESTHGIYVLVSYCLLTVLPLVWLSTRGK